MESNVKELNMNEMNMNEMNKVNGGSLILLTASAIISIASFFTVLILASN